MLLWLAITLDVTKEKKRGGTRRSARNSEWGGETFLPTWEESSSCFRVRFVCLLLVSPFFSCPFLLLWSSWSPTTLWLFLPDHLCFTCLIKWSPWRLRDTHLKRDRQRPHSKTNLGMVFSSTSCVQLSNSGHSHHLLIFAVIQRWGRNVWSSATCRLGPTLSVAMVIRQSRVLTKIGWKRHLFHHQWASTIIYVALGCDSLPIHTLCCSFHPINVVMPPTHHTNEMEKIAPKNWFILPTTSLNNGVFAPLFSGGGNRRALEWSFSFPISPGIGKVHGHLLASEKTRSHLQKWIIDTAQ